MDPAAASLGSAPLMERIVDVCGGPVRRSRTTCPRPTRGPLSIMSDPPLQRASEPPANAAEADGPDVPRTETEAGGILLLEEGLSVTKRRVVAGKIRVSTRTVTHDEVAETTLARDVLDVRRVPIERFVDVAPRVRTEGDTTIVPIIEERLVMVKQLYLKEELHIRHSVERRTFQETVPLRSQSAVVERVDADGRGVEQGGGPGEPG